jgi:hypothetical protein
MKFKNKVELFAWTGGFLEGEGSFCLRRDSNGNLTPKVCAGQKYIEPLKVLEHFFGGGIYPSQDIYKWQCDSFQGVKYICDNVYPFLIYKKDKAIFLSGACEFLLENFKKRRVGPLRKKVDQLYNRWHQELIKSSPKLKDWEVG